MNRIRPYSAAWWRNQNKQGDNITVDTLTGFPEMVAASGIPDWLQASAYVKDTVVYRGASLFRSNSAIVAGTAFVEGTGANEWTNISEAPGVISQYDPLLTYAKDTPVSVGDVLYRAKTSGLTGVFNSADWDRLSVPPGRVFMSASDSDAVLLNAFQTQEIIFSEDVSVGGFDFKEGDRALIRNDLTGAITAADFHYYPFSAANPPTVPPTVTDVVRTATIGDDVGFFYVINPEEDITLDVNVTDKITWTAGSTPDAAATLASIAWFKMDSGTTETLEPGTGFQEDAADNKIFQILGGEGLSEGDVLTLTYTV